MATFPKLKLKQFPQVQDRETSEAKYWKSFLITGEEKLLGAANCIHFDPSGSGQYIVTNSTKVTLYDALTDKVQRSYSRFENDAYSGKFRRDGKLIVAGDKTGCVKVFDVTTKAVLRQLKKHTAAVHATVWTGDALHIVSGSDDKSINLWELATGNEVWRSTNAHTDYIRCLDSSPVDDNMFISGSYDHTVTLWDRRQSEAVRSVVHGHPISAVSMTAVGTMFLSAGGNEVKVWDLLSGGRLLHTFANHQKDVTSIALNLSNTRLFSTGLDGHLKIYDFKGLQLVHGIKFSTPLVSVGVSPSGNKFVVGCVDGRLETRTRSEKVAEADEGEQAETAEKKNRLRHYKGAGAAAGSSMGANADEDEAADAMPSNDGVVDHEKSVRLKAYEVHLKKFNYQLALDAALKTRNPLIAFTVLEELCRRNGLVEALSGRDELTVEPVLSFASRFVSHPRYTKLLVTVLHVVLDLYAGALGHSDAIDELFLKLQRQVKNEVLFQRQVGRVMGSLDGIISASLNASVSSKAVPVDSLIEVS